MAVNCAVYKSGRKPDYYLYLRRDAGQEDDLSSIPETLSSLLGELEFVMELELSEARKLAQADVVEVMRALHESGFYLQTPPKYETVNYIENSKL